MRYVRYTHGSNASNTAAVLSRAQGLFCKDDLGFNLFAAKFQEMLGEQPLLLFTIMNGDGLAISHVYLVL